MTDGATQLPARFDQPMGQTFLFHEDRLEWDSGGARKIFGFDEIASVRFHPITDMDTRNPFFEIRTRDGRRGKVQELARVRELFGLFRGVLAPAMASRLRGEIEGGAEVVFDEERHNALSWLVLWVVLGVFTLLVIGLAVAGLVTEGREALGDLTGLALVFLFLLVPFALVLGKYVVLRNRGVVVSRDGLKRALSPRHPWVGWHEIRSVTVLDQQLVMATGPGQSPVTLSYKASNFVVFPALVRPLLPPEVPWEWKLEALRPGGRPGGRPPPRWKTVEH